jgi:hypothetical protein
LTRDNPNYAHGPYPEFYYYRSTISTCNSPKRDLTDSIINTQSRPISSSTYLSITKKIPPTIMPKTDEGAALGHASFWDERYAHASSDSSAKPTHEWFRDFASLEPFFARHLFAKKEPGTRPRILHLGSGDSVGFLFFFFFFCRRAGSLLALPIPPCPPSPPLFLLLDSRR